MSTLNDLRNNKFCFGCFQFHFRKFFAKAPRKGEKYFIFATFCLKFIFCIAVFGWLRNS